MYEEKLVSRLDFTIETSRAAFSIFLFSFFPFSSRGTFRLVTGCDDGEASAKIRRGYARARRSRDPIVRNKPRAKRLARLKRNLSLSATSNSVECLSALL